MSKFTLEIDTSELRIQRRYGIWHWSVYFPTEGHSASLRVTVVRGYSLTQYRACRAAGVVVNLFRQTMLPHVE